MRIAGLTITSLALISFECYISISCSSSIVSMRFFKYPHRKTSRRLKLDDREGQGISPPRPFHGFGYTLIKCSLAIRLKCVGVTSYMNHIFREVSMSSKSCGKPYRRNSWNLNLRRLSPKWFTLSTSNPFHIKISEHFKYDLKNLKK